MKKQLSLFDINKINANVKAQTQKTKSKAIRSNENIKTIIGKAQSKISDVIGNIKMNETIHYVSVGEWSMHDLLFYILDQIGPSDVYIATWSISEDAVRQLITKTKNGMIKKIICLFDWRVKIRRPEAFELAKFNIADIRLTSSHAKVTVIENHNWSIVIIGSANYTNNPRIEAEVISCNKVAAEFHKSWIISEVKHSDPFNTKKRNKNDKV